jgi:hypothetical protein
MPVRAKILLAGTFVATALCAGAANAQSSGVENVQVQFGDVFAGQKLNVIDPSEGVRTQAQATGNAVAANVEAGDLSYGSSQLLNAAVTGQARTRIHGWSPETVTTAMAVGNSGHVAVRDGDLSAGARQVIGWVAPVSAEARVRSEPSSSGDTSVSAVAQGNNHGFDAAYYAGIAAEQANHSTVAADAKAKLAHTMFEANINAMAAANTATTQGGNANVEIGQVRGGNGPTRATTRGRIENGSVVNAMSSAIANEITAVHNAPYLAAVTGQENESDVIADTRLHVGEFGGATATADGIGNTVYAGSYGEEVTLNTRQTNAGDIDVRASFTGGSGYDAGVKATAMGNTVTGFACSECETTLDATNRQVNHGGVSAVANTRIHGAARGVTGSAMAVGNSAVYHVTRPN